MLVEEVGWRDATARYFPDVAAAVTEAEVAVGGGRGEDHVTRVLRRRRQGLPRQERAVMTATSGNVCGGVATLDEIKHERRRLQR